MTEAEIWAFVTDAPTGILTTLRRDGVPVALPIWFACLDGAIYLQTRGKKLQRIAHDPRASFLVETGHRWVDLKAVAPLARPLTLPETKAQPELAGMALLRIGRLSVTPVTAAEWAVINEMAR